MLEYTTSAVKDVAQETAPALQHAADRVNEMASDGLAAIRAGSRQCRDQMLRASRGAASHVQRHPAQTILIAALLGAAAVTLLSLLRRR